MDKSKVIFGNKMSRATYKKAVRGKKGYVKKFGDDSNADYELTIRDNKHIGDILGVKDIVVARPEKNKGVQTEKPDFDMEKGLIVGNIRMGFGHYRISMAIASAAHSMGYTPYWMDLNSFPDTT